MSKLRPYQKEGVHLITHFNGRALLADDMRLGKTIQALWWFKKHPNKHPVIIICPANVKWVWEQQCKQHIKTKGLVLEGRTPNISKKYTILILNYEILSHWQKYLHKLKPKIVIIDECHYIKNRFAQRTKAVKKLCKKIPHIIAISGTPLLNRPAELWTTLNLLRPDIWFAFFPFALKHCKPERTPFGWTFKGAERLHSLHRKLKKYVMIRRLKEEVFDQLPSKERHIIPFEIKDKDKYNRTLRSLSNKTIPSQAKRLAHIGLIKRQAALLKMDSVIQWIDDFLEDNNGKIVLYAIHKKIIKQLKEKYKDISVVVDGSTNHKKRKQAYLSFQHNKKIRIFIGNIYAAGVGIDLGSADDLAFIELDWTPGNHTQAEDRIFLGEKKKINIYYLIAKDTIEEKLCSLIQKKQKVCSRILDGNDNINSLNLFDVLEKTLLKEL